MPKLRLERDEFASRLPIVRRVLACLSPDKRGPACEIVNMPDECIAIGVYTGLRPSSVIREWRFPTKIKGVRANYYEIWRPLMVRGQPSFFLHQAYLTLFQKESPNNEKELLALHCDPDEPDSRTALYKRGPHVHIKAAAQPIPKAHFALAKGQLDQVLSNVSSLTNFLAMGVQMIDDEVLTRFREG